MAARYIFDLRARRLGGGIGKKAAKLRTLIEKGFRTPRAYVCVWEAYERYLADDPRVIDRVRQELSDRIDPGTAYAVRSSANVEDGADRSFAGQFRSVLQVRGVDDLLQAIWSVWSSTQSPSVQAYLAQHEFPEDGLKMAVLLQEMVPAAISGVSFSKNPTTGLDEIIVEAVTGSGAALVQEGVTPQRWINKWGAWITRPDDDATDLTLIQEVVDGTRAIAQELKTTVDLEWVYDGQSVHWIQLREITALDVDVYANHISKEVFPGIIKPLIWSINVPLVNGAWVRLFAELIGPHDIAAESLARRFYCRAYFNMGTIGRIFEMLGLPRESLELLMGIDVGGPNRPGFRPGRRTYRLLPRLLLATIDKLRFSRKIEAFLPAAQQGFHGFRKLQTERMDERQLLAAIDRLFPLVRQAAYYNIVTPLLMQGYNRVLRRQLGRWGLAADRLDLTRGLEGLEQFDPNPHLRALHQQFERLDEESQARLRASGTDALPRLRGAERFQSDFQRFLDQFGHLSDSGNDFSSVPWREQPDLILSMVADLAPSDHDAADKLGFDELALPFVRRVLLRPIYERARRYALYREAVSSLYTFGYGLFRDLFLPLGERLAARDLLPSRADIHYLTFEEVREIVAAGAPRARDARERIAARKWEIESVRDVALPSVIYGEDAPPVETPVAERLQGTPTSRGTYTGPARVVRGIRDFHKLAAGDVLVIPFSDVGWTPLFTRAGAVIAESGGILSHSSIVAREYNIPAVVSVAGACQLADNTIVTVDGYRGEIIIHASQEDREVL